MNPFVHGLRSRPWKWWRIVPWEHRREAYWSFMIGSIAALIATFVGILVAWGLRTRRLPSLPISLLLAIVFSIPGPLLGVWVIRLLNHPQESLLGTLTWCYDHTILAPVIVQVLRSLPLATLVLSSQFESIPSGCAR